MSNATVPRFMITSKIMVDKRRMKVKVADHLTTIRLKDGDRIHHVRVYVSGGLLGNHEPNNRYIVPSHVDSLVPYDRSI
jgi:hypothetical protein